MAVSTFLEIQDKVYDIVRDGNASAASPSEAFPLAEVKEEINQVYFDVFNQPNTKPYLSQKYQTFDGVPDTTLSAAASAGAATLTVTSTTGYPSSGSLYIDDSDLVTYTGTTATTFTGVSGLTVDHASSARVQPLYDLPSDIDEQKIVMIHEKDLLYPYYFMEYEFRTRRILSSYTFTIINGKLMFEHNQNASNIFMMVYQSAPVEMTADGDTPSLIPSSFRIMLAYGAAGRLLMADDDMRYQRYYDVERRNPKGMLGAGLYFDYLKRFYAKFNKRTGIRPRQGQHVFVNH